ncbi:MAG: aminotransferase class I/II-fold pyridoxal phosphate-dependent enzyme [Thermoplasmatota archaeon]
MSLAFLEEALREARALGRHRRLRTLSGLGPHARLDGRTLLVLASNSYLGLHLDARVVEAAKAAAASGTSSGSSRLVAGTTAAHEALERALAAHKGQPAATLLGTGYQASLAAVTTLVQAQDVVVSDALNHASLIDACRLSGATIQVYGHGDAAAAEALLKMHRARHRRALIVTDGVFSMDGDLAPLRELAEVARANDAALMVDDAHGTGVLGRTGGGTAEHLGAAGIDVHMGTLSKALASSGGFLAGPGELQRALVNFARPLLFSTAPAPPAVAAAHAALEIVKREPELRERVLSHAATLRRGLEQMGLDVTPGVTPIVPVLMGSEKRAVAFSAALEEEGVYVPAIRPPSVPPGSSRLRVTVSALHTPIDLEQALAAFEAAHRRVR